MIAFVLTCYFFSSEAELPEFTLRQRRASEECNQLFKTRQLCLRAEDDVRESFFTNHVGVVTSCDPERQTKGVEQQ